MKLNFMFLIHHTVVNGQKWTDLIIDLESNLVFNLATMANADSIAKKPLSMLGFIHTVQIFLPQKALVNVDTLLEIKFCIFFYTYMIYLSL